MPDLIAQGPEPKHRWRRSLPCGKKVVIGRTAGLWITPWDDRVSQRHVEICWEYGRLLVERLPAARNPIFFHGQNVDSFFVAPGEHFVIGETAFTLADEQVDVSGDFPRPVTEQTFSPDYLTQLSFRDADQRIDVLSRLPEIISSANSDNELFVRMVNVLLTGIPRATAAAIVAVPSREEAGATPRVDVLHWDRQILSGEDFRPSRRLILESVKAGESVVHVFSEAAQRGSAAFTLHENVDWAFCTPLEGDACRGWAIYVAGRFGAGASGKERPSDPGDLRDDLKFAKLAATTLGSLREVRMLERNHASLSQFFSPVVIEAIGGEDPGVVLAPRQTEVSVLFCDLRGFSRESERSAGDLMGLLRRVSRALGVATRHIFDSGGVVGDFHGDAVMGFWGWPLTQDDAAERACRAALAIEAEFTSATGSGENPLADFQMGIGIATGAAVAGKIGTVDQVKVTVFGPVVNVASRLEGMTSQMHVSILLDGATAAAVRENVPRDVARVRRVAVVRPYGMDSPLTVSELLPPASEGAQPTDDHLATYEAALDAFYEGDWALARKRLHQIPEEDPVADFLAAYIGDRDAAPLDGWDGVIPLASK